MKNDGIFRIYTRGNWRSGFITHFDDSLLFFCIICIVIRWALCMHSLSQKNVKIVFQFINRKRAILIHMHRISYMFSWFFCNFCEETGKGEKLNNTRFPTNDFIHNNIKNIVLELDYRARGGERRTRIMMNCLGDKVPRGLLVLALHSTHTFLFIFLSLSIFLLHRAVINKNFSYFLIISHINTFFSLSFCTISRALLFRCRRLLLDCWCSWELVGGRILMFVLWIIPAW